MTVQQRKDQKLSHVLSRRRERPWIKTGRPGGWETLGTGSPDMCAIHELREQGADSHVHLTPVSSSRKLPAEEKVERSLGATPPHQAARRGTDWVLEGE